LLDFVVKDERLTIIKVYATWCKTCKAFDLRFRKLATQEGDKYDKQGNMVEPGRVRFAEIDYNQNEELCQLLGAEQLPYILAYKGASGKMDDFQAGPSHFKRVIDLVDQYAGTAKEAAILAEEGQVLVPDLESVST